jgi:hypothetical protein
MDLVKSQPSINFSNKKSSFFFIIFSGEIKEIHANFCPAIGGSSSHKSIYLGFGFPFFNVFLSKFAILLNTLEIFVYIYFFIIYFFV